VQKKGHTRKAPALPNALKNRNNDNLTEIRQCITDRNYYLSSHAEEDAKPWIIVFNEVPPEIKNRINHEGIYISSISDWKTIKKIIKEENCKEK